MTAPANSLRGRLLSAALKYATDGIPVFPCKVGAKPPACAHGVKDATCDQATIERWWSEADYNIGLALESAGLCAIDLDGPEGEAAWLDLGIENDFAPDTREHQTPHGRHLLFRGSLPPTVSKIGTKIDTRGRGSFIVAPPSIVDGKQYQVSNALEPVPLPDWIARLLAASEGQAVKAADIKLDQSQNVARAVRYLKEDARPAIEGQGGDAGTYETAAAVRDLGISEKICLLLMAEHYNPRCTPVWLQDELAAKVANAYRYAENEPGCYAVAPVTERIPCDVLDRFKAESAEASPAVADNDDAPYPRPMKAGELADGSFPVPFYAWDNFILAENVNLLYGDGGTGKTLLLLFVAVAIAAGKNLFGCDTKQMPAFVVLAEDDYGPTKQRLEKVCAALGVAMGDLPLYIWCLPGRDVTLAAITDEGSSVAGPLMAPLRAMLKELGQPAFIGLDTVSDLAALDETKRLAVNTFCKQILGGFCRDFQATVAVSAHPSKAAMADGSGYAGSTAWNNSVRSRLTLERPDSSSNRRVLRVAKSNYGANAELELQMVDGVFWQRDQGDAAEADARLMTACVAAAEAAAKQGTPVQKQRRPPKWVFDMIERDVGRRPTVRELREVLDYAQRAGRVRFLMGNSRRVAGYYPWDEQRAAELAVEAKRHSATVEVLSAGADKREANNG